MRRPNISAKWARTRRVGTIAVGLWLVGAATGRAEQLIRDADLVPHDLTRFWQATLPLRPGEELKDLYLVDENLYCTTTAGTVFTVHRDVGIIRWSVNLTNPAYPIFRPAHLSASPTDGHAVFATGGTLVYLDRRSGQQHRRLELGFAAGSGPVIGDDLIFLASASGRLFCMQLPGFLPKWQLAMSGGIHHAPTLWESKLFFASGDGHVVSCTASSKAVVWTSQLGVPVSAPSVVTSQAGLLVPAGDRLLYQFDLEDGRAPQWRAQFGSDLRESPSVSLDTIYQPVDQEGIYALSMDGGLVWRAEQGRRFLTEINDLAFILTEMGQVEARDKASGKHRYDLPAEEVSIAVSDPLGASMYLAGSDGRLLCVRSKDAPYMRTDQVQAALRGQVAGKPTTKPAVAKAGAADAAEPQDGAAPADADVAQAADDDQNPLKTKIRTKPLSGRAINP